MKVKMKAINLYMYLKRTFMRNKHLQTMMMIVIFQCYQIR